MRKIHKLPDHIVAQIAAGEVIERPAYALKELLENAVDAKADRIQVYLENAGLKKIMVIDNGEGMNYEDIQESFKHHTTSKLHKELIGIKSLGFRGEALSSIAAISNFTIKSKQKESSSGNVIFIRNGKVEYFSPLGMPHGTTVMAEHLFFSFPARKKFLRSNRTEMRYNTDVFLKMVLDYPTIHFSFIHNKRLLFDFPKTNEETERVKSILGNDIFSQLIPVQYNDGYIEIKGFISKPNIININTYKQYLSVNGRQINDKKISQIIKDSYEGLLDAQAYPIFVLQLTIPHESVDVNVHPRKEEIAFLNEEELYKTIGTTIKKSLQTSNLTQTASFLLNTSNNMPYHATGVLRDELASWDWLNITKILPSSAIIQIHKTYILTQTYTGFLLIDQHAAHERILYEELKKTFLKKKEKSFTHALKNPLTIEMTFEDLNIVMESRQKLGRFGFIVEEFGTNTLRITHIPELFKDHNLKKLFFEIVSTFQKNRLTNIDSQSEVMLQFLACRSAIKAGDILSTKQCKQLIDQLEKTPNNYTCPHGRPTKSEFSLRNLHKLFKRIS